MFSERQSIRRWLLGAMLAGALVRLPGVAWGVNWPDGFTIHHPDEYTHIANADAIISPLGPATGVAYPKAFAAYAATPFLAWYGLHGSFGGARIHLPWIVGSGRLISVAFGLAAILLVFLITRDALHHEEAGVLAAWLMVACVVSSAGCRRRVAEVAEYKDAIAPPAEPLIREVPSVGRYGGRFVLGQTVNPKSFNGMMANETSSSDITTQIDAALVKRGCLTVIRKNRAFVPAIP